MSVDIVKHFRVRDEYNHKSFNAKDAWIYGKNGLVRGGDISIAGSTITVQPFVFVQQGMVIEKLTPLYIEVPSGSDLLNRRHFIGINVANAVESASEVLGAVFIARPEDYNDTVVLIAEYDLAEYRKLPYISINESFLSQGKNNIVGARVGINSGLSVVNNPPGSSTYIVGSGTLTDKTGRVIDKKLSEQFVVNPVDPDYPNRVDQIVFRTPTDSPNRVGAVELITGDATKIGASADSMVALPSVSSYLPQNLSLH
jgi:hypothetical protein